MKVIMVKSLPGRMPPACCTLEAWVPNNLLTSKRASRYKRISSSSEDQDADDQDPDH